MSVVEDVACYGADAGFGGFVDTRECVEFHDAHKDVIWQPLEVEAPCLLECPLR